MITDEKRVNALCSGSRRSPDRRVIGFTTTGAIDTYYYKSSEFESRSWWCVLNINLFDKVCQLLVAGWWFSSRTLISSINKTVRHSITEILLKVVLNHITPSPLHSAWNLYFLAMWIKFDIFHFQIFPQKEEIRWSGENFHLWYYDSLLKQMTIIELMYIIYNHAW
jgi:hypothetical protein